MKFVCDRCHTRYNISDEKVKGKVLKVRCKTCGNIIVVREQGAESAVAVAAAGGSRGPAPRTEVDMGARKSVPPARPNIEWFVAIKGKQHGPMSHDEVVRFFREGKIHERSYCWHEDLAGWTRLRELPDFKDLTEEPVKTPSSPPGPPPEDDRGAEVVSLDAHRQQRQSDLGPLQPAASPKDDPFAAVAGASPAAPLAEGAPRESTRVFIMNAGLHNRDKKHRTYAIVAIVATLALVALGYLDYTGTVRIPILSTVNEKIASVAGDEKKLAAIKLQKFEDIAGEMSEEEAAYMRCKLAGDGCPPEKRQRLKRRYERSQGGGGSSDDLDLDGAFNSGPDGRGRVARKDGAADADFGGIKSTGVSGLLGGRDGPSGPKVRLPAAQTIAVSGSELTGEQISKVVTNNKESIQKCIESAAKNAGGQLNTAKRRLVLVIATNGKVKSSRIAHGPTNASDLGSCINRRAKRWVFPSASKETEVEIPLILTTSF